MNRHYTTTHPWPIRSISESSPSLAVHFLLQYSDVYSSSAIIQNDLTIVSFKPTATIKFKHCSFLNYHVSDLLLQLSPIIPYSNLTPQYTSFPPIDRKYKLPTFLNLLGLQTYHLLLDRLLPIITSGVLSIAGVIYDIHTYRHIHLLSISVQGQCQCFIYQPVVQYIYMKFIVEITIHIIYI